MRSYFYMLFSIFCSSSLVAQVFDVDTIKWGGNTSNRVNLVIVGDGYTSGEQDKFITDATAISTAFFQTQPYNEYQDYFNVLAVKVISNESGASHGGISSDNACGTQPVASVDNFFGSSFDCGNNSYHRLLCAGKSYKVAGVMASNCPDYDQVLILVNTSYYGGAGGSVAVTSTNSSANEIAIHEVGHSFAFLADEYWAGSQYTNNNKPNMTNNSNIGTVKWNSWVGTKTVGLYPHSGDPSWFKPVTGKCKMEYLGTNYPFCPVCTEAHVLKVLDLTKPYDDYTPSNAATISAQTDVQFLINTVIPQPNTLKISWSVNGSEVGTGLSNSYTLPYVDLQTELNTVQAIMVDTTALIRSSGHVSAHTYTINWTLDKGIQTGVEVSVKTEKVSFELYPNPTEASSTLALNLEEGGDLELKIIDAQGRLVAVEKRDTVQKGEHIFQINSNLEKGIYYIVLTKNGQRLVSESLVVQ